MMKFYSLYAVGICLPQQIRTGIFPASKRHVSSEAAHCNAQQNVPMDVNRIQVHYVTMYIYQLVQVCVKMGVTATFSSGSEPPHPSKMKCKATGR